MKNENLFNFGDDSIDIFSSSRGPAGRFEDVVSNSSYVVPGRRYRKKSRGVKGFFKKIGWSISDWWNSLRRWQRVVFTTLTSILLVLCIAIGTVLIVFDYNYNAITSKPEDLGFTEVISKEIVNIALFGIDTREPKSFKGLSDSIMILSINTKTKKIKVISVMRDSLVPITYNGKTTYNKINSAYLKGGPELAIKTLNQAFGLDISEYATVNFYGMADIIDAVGGIEATITEAELTSEFGINQCIAEQCLYTGQNAKDFQLKSAGTQHLNGTQAVAYSRIRKVKSVFGTTDDYGRTDRQRYVMEQLFDKATTMSKSKYVSLAKALIPCSETSLSYDQILSLATKVLLNSPTFEQSRIPLEEYVMSLSKPISGVGSCVYYDLKFASKVLHAFIYDNILPEDYIAQNGVEKNDWYKGGSSGGTSSGSKNPSSSPSSSTSSGGTSTDITDPDDKDQDPTDPDGTDPDDKNPSGENPGGETPGGENPGGETPGGENPGGENPGDTSPGGENPGGAKPGGTNSGGNPQNQNL